MHQQDSTEALLFQILYKPYLQFHHAIASISVIVTQVSRNPRCAGDKAEVGSWIVAGAVLSTTVSTAAGIPAAALQQILGSWKH